MDAVSVEGAGSQSRCSTLTRREKALVKRNVQRPMLFNGHDTLNRGTLPSGAKNVKVPKKTPKGYTFWALVFALYIVAIGNLLLTVTIFSVLRLTKNMESIEVVTPSNLMKFYGEVNIERIIKGDGRISGYADKAVDITSTDSEIGLKVLTEDNLPPAGTVSVGPNSIKFENINRFDMLHPGRKTTAFSTMFPNFGLPKGVQKLIINKASVSRITSGLDSSLVLQSDSQVRIRGNERINIGGKELNMFADQDLILRSINGSIIIEGKEGIIIDPDNIPIVNERFPRSVTEYKLCICMPRGNLYRVPVLESDNSINCGSVDLTGEDSPCF